jgi:hypothetical protein
MLLKCRQLLVMVLLCGSAASVCSAAGDPPGRLHGTIVGVVSDASGGARLGATVYLFTTRVEKLVRKVLTNENGAFGFDFLPPDSYSVRVVLPSFLPAVRQNILIQPGIRSFLAINLASLVNSVELVYPGQSPAPLMTDEWKWVLRGTMTTRPVLRYAPQPSRQATTVFGDTRAVVRVQAGDGASGVFGGQPDLGTAFAVATSFLHRHELQVTGNLGYASRGGVPGGCFADALEPSGDQFGVAGRILTRGAGNRPAVVCRGSGVAGASSAHPVHCGGRPDVVRGSLGPD